MDEEWTKMDEEWTKMDGKWTGNGRGPRKKLKLVLLGPVHSCPFLVHFSGVVA